MKKIIKKQPIIQQKEFSLRELIVHEARTWLGTRWQHQGRVKQNDHFQGGVDCAGLIIEVGNALSLFPQKLMLQHYSRLPHQDVLLSLCNEHLIPKYVTQALPGDILVFRIKTMPQHLALLTSHQAIIHAYVQAKRVVENSFNQEWQQKCVAVYQYPGIY